MSHKDWKTYLAFMALMVGVSLFDERLALWTMAAAGVVFIIRNPDLLQLPFGR